MMLQLGDDGVLRKADEENLISVDEKELDELIDKANELLEENKQLKQALLFFLDVANSQCSSSFGKDMEHDCRKLFNCSYDEAKDKYGGYDATWWELGE